jgi:PAS domain-containing protein
MQAGKDAEARCLSVLQTQTRCEEEAMKAWAANPEGPMPQADFYARQMNEEALANARRISTTIAAAEPEHSARQTQAVNDLTALQSQLPALLHAIMMEDAAILREELDATITRANEQSARLFGLRSYLEEQRATETAQAVPVTFEMWPAQSAIKTAHQHWQAYAERLAANPQATMEN